MQTGNTSKFFFSLFLPLSWSKSMQPDAGMSVNCISVNNDFGILFCVVIEKRHTLYFELDAKICSELLRTVKTQKLALTSSVHVSRSKQWWAAFCLLLTVCVFA